MNVVHVRPAVAPSVQTAHAAGEHEVFWELSPPTFRLAWVSLFALYVFIELYLVGTIGAYVVVSFVPAFAFYADTFHVMPVRNYPPMLALYSLVAAFYFARICQFVYYSLRRRQLVLPASLSPTTGVTASSSRSQSLRAQDAVSTKSTNAEPVPTRSAVRRALEHLCSTTGVCGVRGVYFEPVVMLREVVEIAIQTYQAYVCSQQTAKVWVNATFAGLIVANCCSSPLLHSLHKSIPDRGKHRAAVLVTDLALDFVWFAVIPLLVFVPFFVTIFTNELVLSRDTFVVEGIMELPAFSVMSYVDLLMKLWPPVAIYFTARKIELLTRRKSRTAIKSSQSGVTAKAQRSTRSRRSITPVEAVVSTPVPPTPSRPAPAYAASHSQDATLRTRIERWLRLLLLVWGHAVLAVYVHANFVHSPTCSAGCQLVLRPWLHVSHTCQCAALEVDCHALRISGTASEIEDALAAANTHADGLMNLIVTHCPALHVPRVLGTLRNLYGLVFFNCSIASWHADAWITSARHPKLGRVQLVHTFVADVPKAILHADLPSRLLEIDIVASNLSHLPDDVAQHWSRLNTLLLDRGRFREYPSVLGRMPALETVSLYGNQIAHIPDGALANNSGLRFVHVAENPLDGLPVSLGLCSQLASVLAMATRVEDVSSPFVNGSRTTALESLRVFGFASPVCEGVSPSTPVNATATWLRCEDKHFVYRHAKSSAYYPLEAKLAEKQPR